ncbi:hypothetical protein GN316_20810 [Xylophilus sp. Kf1]|nr:hypothetical protein [Xylophilus sp. Kf1]
MNQKTTIERTTDPIGPSDAGALPGGRVEGGSTGDQVAVDFDDDEIYSGTGNHGASGGTNHAKGGDSGKVETPSEQLSGSNEPRERNF